MPHFKSWIKSNAITNDRKILCAISGGLDSMVMMDLFIKHDIKIEVMHMNYQLRAKESDLDQLLVEEICAKHKIKCHVKKVVKPKACNTQEWARNERYQFIQDLNTLYEYHFIATAHHKQDQLETILLSIFKGYSLQTIKALRDNIMRPLLDVSREDILSYASANDVEYRQDQSNFSNNYDRNYLRNDIIPSLRNRFENFDKRVLKFAERQMRINHLSNQLIVEKTKRYSKIEFNNLGDYSYECIDLEILKENDGRNLLELYLKQTFGFNHSQFKNLIDSQDHSAKILSQNHICSKDGQKLYIGLVEEASKELEVLKDALPYSYQNLSLKIGQKENYSGGLMIDFDKLVFPLSLKKVTNSDKFHAFGLKGKSTSLTKYLKDKGISSLRRSHDYLIKDASDQIILPGIEIDYRLKITNKTKTALIIDLQDKTTHRFLDTNED